MAVTIPVGQSEACSNVSLIDDDIAEGTQTFSLSIQSASPPAMSDSSEMVVIEIMDNDGMLEFLHQIIHYKVFQCAASYSV